eukprot:CAMPEP_0198447416 /NCGR_PEP_ID=MMETSP1453-20131121/2395_1 /TAXON_ID=1461543 ORGANISM="Unidentified sp., Strain RCC701" /NCGR_SAMPLE_ID=MMETSP1453 /ASSEMBLY_ACC=CAM_ASM_001118 /LENGTH=59 /DNA_ID=CAMNT_0044169219 /DNA_START=37 /DNA_END=213 /DNA_ORIENTATION=-
MGNTRLSPLHSRKSEREKVEKGNIDFPLGVAWRGMTDERSWVDRLVFSGGELFDKIIAK